MLRFFCRGFSTWRWFLKGTEHLGDAGIALIYITACNTFSLFLRFLCIYSLDFLIACSGHELPAKLQLFFHLHGILGRVHTSVRTYLGIRAVSPVHAMATMIELSDKCNEETPPILIPPGALTKYTKKRQDDFPSKLTPCTPTIVNMDRRLSQPVERCGIFQYTGKENNKICAKS